MRTASWLNSIVDRSTVTFSIPRITAQYAIYFSHKIAKPYFAIKGFGMFAKLHHPAKVATLQVRLRTIFLEEVKEFFFVQK